MATTLIPEKILDFTGLQINATQLKLGSTVIDGTDLGEISDTPTFTSATITTLTAPTINSTNIDAGASGTVGTVDIFPATAASGKTQITAANNAGNTTTTITNASQAGARTYTIPDAGASASFAMTEGAQTINGAKTFGSAIIRAGVVQIVPAYMGRVGATAGWTVANDGGLTLLPASQTNSTFIIPISGLNIGDQITAVAVNGQVESAGNNVTLVMSVRKQTAAAADFTDAELATDNVGTLTADTQLSSANLGVTGLTETIASGEYVYVLLTGTTAASTDIALGNLEVTVTKAY